MNTSEDIKKIRDEKGWTQQQLAEFLNTTKSNVSGWEKGLHKPNGETWVKICELRGNKTSVPSKTNNKTISDMQNRIDELTEENSKLKDRIMDLQEKLLQSVVSRQDDVKSKRRSGS